VVVFERFTERARQAVVFAQTEARGLHHPHIGCEHLLLGLRREEAGLAAQALVSCDVTLERARPEVMRRVASGDEPTSGQMTFTAHANQVMECAAQESLELGHNYIETEHLLLSLASLHEREAMTVLRDLGVDSDTIRAAVMRLLPGPSGRRPARVSRTWEVVFEDGARVVPADDVVSLLTNAGARASEDGRAEMTVADLLIALAQPG
jgi:ATP-dependent Clp protease ATP-binding subunit ClpC